MIGLPGDKIQVQHAMLYINGKAVPRKEIGPVTLDRRCKYTQYQETLPNGVKYKVLDLERDGLLDNTQVYEVPPDHYFMMGDNRDNSPDSRVPPTAGGVGYVPVENLVGTRRDHLLLGQGGRAGAGLLAVAVDGPLGPFVQAVYDRGRALVLDALERRLGLSLQGPRPADRRR